MYHQTKSMIKTDNKMKTLVSDGSLWRQAILWCNNYWAGIFKNIKHTHMCMHACMHTHLHTHTSARTHANTHTK
jgi:hypothetical protein